ncbi:MAG: amidohydrolase family protein [Anaerolineae bacterium]
MITIDAHTHILPPEIITARAEYMASDRWFGLLHASPRSRLASAEDLVASMDRAGIEASVTFGFGFQSAEACRRCNDYVLDAAARWPERIIPFAVVSPTDGDAGFEADRCLRAGAAGIGELMPDGQGFDLDDAALQPVIQLLQERNTPLMLHVNERVGHSYPGKGRSGPEEAFALAATHPELRLILSHWGGGLPFYELMPSARATLTNVWYDTAASSLLYDDQIFSMATGWAPSKVLFGTDYPLLTQRRLLQRVLALEIPDERLQGLLSVNLLTALGRSTG